MTFPTPAKPAVSRSTLERSLSRALLFLRGVGSSPSIRRDLEKGGYTAEDHDTGWRLLREACGEASAEPDTSTNPARMAEKELDGWLDPALRRAQAVLRHLHPEAERLVFDGLHRSCAESATLGAIVFLERWTMLDNEVRFASAAAALAARGLTGEERSRIANLVRVATAEVGPANADGPTRVPTTDDLIRLHAWLTDWSDTALALVHRKVDLIRLGISRRRPRASKQTVPALPVVG